MNAVELYKNLPRTNCGECRMKNCMPFALSVLTGESNLAECPYLTEEERSAIGGSLRTEDWREELISRLKDEVKDIRFSDIAEGLGCSMTGSSLVIPCMGRDCIVHPDGEVESQGPMTPWAKILLLHYFRSRGNEALTGKWISYSEVRGGMVKASSFLRDCEEPIRELFDARYESVESLLPRLGARRTDGFPTLAWVLHLMPKVPVVMLYWPADDEFPSKLKVLFDSTADRFLDAESLIFLVEGLAMNLQRMSSHQAGS